MDKNGDKAKIHLQRMLTLLPKKKKEISSKLIASIIRKMTIMLTSVLR